MPIISPTAISPHSRRGQPWSSYWATQSEVLFLGLYSEIADGKMPNKVTGATDYITVAGAVGSETYTVPNTAPYITADTDYVWFKTDGTQRTVTTAELIGYDLQRTPVKYEDDAPNTIVAIIILNSSVTGIKRDRLFRDMWLPLLWDNDLNANGHIKSNRITQELFEPFESEIYTYISGLTTPISRVHQVKLNNFILDLKEATSSTDLSDSFDVFRVYANETSEVAVRNLVGVSPVAILNGTLSGGMLHDVSKGFYNASTSNYIDENFDLNDLTNYTLNNASVGIFQPAPGDSLNTRRSVGIKDGTNNMAIILSKIGANSFFTINHGGTSVYGSAFKNTGTHIVCRESESSVKIYEDGSAMAVSAGSGYLSNGIPVGNVFSFTANGDNVPTSNYISILFFGRSFTATEAADITTAIETYLNSI